MHQKRTFCHRPRPLQTKMLQQAAVLDVDVLLKICIYSVNVWLLSVEGCAGERKIQCHVYSNVGDIRTAVFFKTHSQM